MNGKLEAGYLDLPGGKGCLNFADVGLSAPIAHGLKRALVAEMGHTSVGSIRTAFRTIKDFAMCMGEHGFAECVQLPADSLSLYREWIVKQSRGSSGAQLLNIVRRLLAWCLRNVPAVVHPKLFLLVPTLAKPPRAPRKALSGDVIKKILAACYQDIEAVEAKLDRGARLLVAKGKLSTADKVTAQALKAVLSEDGLSTLRRDEVQQITKVLALVDRAGGLRALHEMLWLTREGLLPYYLAILVQTSGNPESILQMRRNCISKHPLREDIERLVWMKWRARGEQRADFPCGKRWSAPELVRRIASANEKLLGDCLPEERDMLFVCKVPSRRRSGVPQGSGLHQLLAQFIARHELPPFTFQQLRQSGAVLHHKAAGSMEAVGSRLNHRSLRTTQFYTTPATIADQHETTIRRFQGELLASSLGLAADDRAHANATGHDIHPAETVFGFGCKDPLAGVAAGSRRGSACLQFTRCATCPGALVVLDDPAVVARLLAANEALEAARVRSLQEGWWPRFEVLYEPTRVILTKDLLPAVSEGVRQAARELPSKPVPWLE